MKKPLSFGMTMLASALGVIIVSVIGAIVMFVMMVALVASVSTMGSDNTTNVRDNTFVSLDLGRIAGDRTASELQQAISDGKTIGLIDAIAAIRRAATDDRVAGLYITDPGSLHISWASLTELRDAIESFRTSGKPVVAYATAFSQGGYYLASAAGRVCLHPAGMVDFRGIGADVMFYKDLLDRLGIEMQLIRPESCSYKSAGEVYTMNHMSDANREQIRSYISGIWNVALRSIGSSRQLSISQLNGIADNLSGYMADGALSSHLVDTLCFEEDVRQMLKKQYEGKQLLPITKYGKSVKAANVSNAKKSAIAVVYAQGNVVDGSGSGDAVYGDDIVRALKKAADDDNVKAIVLRVNSPGGSATASESMTHAVISAKSKKPVIVSMGDLAASAGYEMSCMADVIVAQPTTITGSIGVFATLPNVGKMMKNKIGLNSDTVKTNHNAADLTIFRPLSPAAKALMNRNVEDFYKTFVGRVAEGRHLTPEAVQRIARGRVWTGSDAMAIGLVDTLGGIDLAMQIAAQQAELEDYRIVEYPKQNDIWQQLSDMFGESDDTPLNLIGKVQLAYRWKASSKTLKVISRFEQDLQYVSKAEGLQARLPFVIIDE